MRELHTEQNMERLAEWLEGEDRYFLQDFVDSGDLIFPGLHACSLEEMRKFLTIVQKRIPNAQLRGV